MFKKKVNLYLDILDSRIAYLIEFSEINIKFGYIPLLKGIVSNGRIRDIKALEKNIKMIVQKEKIKVNTISYSLNISDIFKRKMMIYESEKEPFIKTVESEISRYLKGEIIDYNIKYKKIKSIGEDEYLTFVTAISKKDINKYYKLTNLLGFQPNKISIKEATISTYENTLEKNNDNNEKLYINLEENITQYYVVVNNEFTYSKVENIGINDLRESLNIKGVISEDKLAAADNLMVTGIIERWIKHAVDIEQFYESRAERNNIDEIVLCGPGAIIYSVFEKFSNYFVTDVSIFTDKLIENEPTAQYFGVAMLRYNIENEINYFEGFELENLKKKIDIKLSLIQSISIFLTMLLLIGGISAHFYFNKKIAGLDKEIKELQTLSASKELNEQFMNTRNLDEKILTLQDINNKSKSFSKEIGNLGKLSFEDIQLIISQTVEDVYINSISFNRNSLILNCDSSVYGNALKHFNKLRELDIIDESVSLSLSSLQNDLSSWKYSIEIKFLNIEDVEVKENKQDSEDNNG